MKSESSKMFIPLLLPATVVEGSSKGINSFELLMMGGGTA